MKTGIIFDVDGTLWDACHQIVESWGIILKKHNITDIELEYEAMKGMMGKQMLDIMREMMPDKNIETAEKIGRECCDYEIEYMRNGHPGVMFNGACETIRKLKEKYFIGIVSNCQDGYIDLLLKAYDLEDFVDDFLCAGMEAVPKSENIKNIMKRNSLDKAFYVGDTMGDFDAVKKTKAEFIYAAYGFGNVDEECYKINEFTELPELIQCITEV